MRNFNENYIKEQIQTNGVESLLSGSNKSITKRVIRQDTLSEDTIQKIWKHKTFQWELAKYQKLPNNIIKDVLENASPRRRGKDTISLTSLSETLLNQLVPEEYFSQLVEKKDEHMLSYCWAWSLRPDKMELHETVDEFFKYTFDRFENHNSGDSIFDYVKDLLKGRPQYLRNFLDIFLENNTRMSRLILLLKELTKFLYFDDDCYKLIDDNFTDIQRYVLLENLFKKNNCSERKKAKFLLENL